MFCNLSETWGAIRIGPGWRKKHREKEKGKGRGGGREGGREGGKRKGGEGDKKRKERRGGVE